jgi:hypothetical protein
LVTDAGLPCPRFHGSVTFPVCRSACGAGRRHVSETVAQMTQQCVVMA